MREKLERWFFYFFIFSIPAQGRLILFEWTKPFKQWTSAYLYGTDVLLATLFIFWFWRALHKGGFLHSLIRANRRIDTGHLISGLIRNSKFFLILFLLVAAASIFNAQIKGLAGYQLLKLAEFVGFYFYLLASFSPPLKSATAVVSTDGLANVNTVFLNTRSNQITTRQAIGYSSGVGFSLRGVLTIIITSGFVQAILGIIQYVKQGSIGLYIFGESPLSVDATGVAVFIADGVKYLRAYGLTPHPNILAAWLFAAVFALYFIYVYQSSNLWTSQDHGSCEVGKFKNGAPTGKARGPLLRRSSLTACPWGGIPPQRTIHPRVKPVVLWGCDRLLLLFYAVLLFGLFFTFSRVIIGLWVLGVLARLLIIFLRKQFRDNIVIRRRITELSVVSLAVVVIFSSLFRSQVKSRLTISANEEAVTQRVFYNKAAASIAEDNPWLGIGLGQFVPEMMDKFKRLPHYAYQPAHNIYLLIASETGFVGLGVFLVFLFYIFRRFILAADFSKVYNFSFLIFVFSFLVIGLFDHFLWTSQQGGFIFWMALALLSVFSQNG